MLQDPTPDAPVPFGKYELIRRIGAGGMGEVFLAREGQGVGGQPPRACVVKKVLPSLLENRAFVGRFLDESRVVTGQLLKIDGGWSVTSVSPEAAP